MQRAAAMARPSRDRRKSEREIVDINAAQKSLRDDGEDPMGSAMVLKTDHILVILSIYERDSI